MKFILAKKLNMTQLWTEDGKVIPVTVLEVPPCKISLLRTSEKDKYQAVQISCGKAKKEFRTSVGKWQVGQEIKVADFEPGEVVDITGISKGRGFTGAVKRHGFHGAPASHGHDHPRAVGSIGQRFPQHVRPGMRMAGRLGGGQATVKHSVVVAVDSQNNLLFVKGGVPGAPKTLLKVAATGRKTSLPKIAEYKKEATEA
jgi:large subunit ribosomal protein L3